MFIVLEIQKVGEVVSTLTYQFTDILDAESKYHTILAAASKSTCDVHTAIIMTEYGFVLKQEHYEHAPEIVPAEEVSENE